mmetsp:Transcript_10532/g.15654  ORF Transcript_10532/g.15654 Transcript_10532/m.15654 type:complete len:525 (+) Transcript_10532:324-1898(+)|eukprot:CAMPEP_0196815890 /NCGR_PEP_ID=MMETSP1362-20130617/52505_1 /TAXON_ID=163516 /ORGANISM="Leptocylindrus danicus, Strain CCMP1856" /LENGTH=524 /DNA_ID=CAMNT_0042193031 /DNA_START=232 /DNA_END=1806 /DNA_ORIENTATION=+
MKDCAKSNSVRQASKATEESGAATTCTSVTNEPKVQKYRIQQQVLKSLDPLVAAMIKGASDEEILNNHALLYAHAHATDENIVRDNALALHLAIERDYSLEVIQKLATPEAMLQFNAYGYLPLHNAIMNERECYVVLSLLGLNQDAAAMQLYDCGSLPLHAAVRNQYSLAVIRALVSAFPDGVVVTDHFGCTPLHSAIMYLEDDSDVEVQVRIAVIQLFLAQSANTVAAIPNADGDLPLHAVLRSKQLQLQLIEGDYLGMVQILVDAFPMALEIPDANGCIPLHIALSDKKVADQPKPDVIECLLEKNEATASIAGFDGGELPLHFALANHYPLGIIQPLVDAFPEGLLASNSSDDFPIFAALKRKDDCMVKYFLSKLPKSSALKSMNRLPIHLAIELCLSTEVICALLVAYPNSLSVGCNGNLPKDLTGVATEPLIVVALEKSIGFWALYAHRFRVKGDSLDVVINDAVTDLEGTHGLQHEVRKKRFDDRMGKDINGVNRSSDALEGFGDLMKRVDKMRVGIM